MPQRYHFIKQAMHVEGEGSYVIAFRDRIWLLEPYEQDDEIFETIESVEKALNLEKNFDDGHSLISDIRDYRPDVLVGQIDEDGIRLMGNDNWRFGTGSHLLRKVMQTLGLKRIYHANSEGYDYREHRQQDVTGETPKLVYHGTNSENAVGILRFGLMPDKAPTNYKGRGAQGADIYHEKTVFLTEDIDSAEHHAFNAMRREMKSNYGEGWLGRRSGFPVIFQFEVPDPALLIPDYDIDIMSEQHSTGAYQNLYDSQGGEPLRPDERIEESPMQFAKQTGSFGYSGRIPPSHIREIYVFINEEVFQRGYTEGFNEADWQIVSPEDLERIIESYEDAGEFWGIARGLDPTLYEDDEEDEDWCPKCGYEREFCECDEEGETVASHAPSMKTASRHKFDSDKASEDRPVADIAETITETFLIHDVDRYVSDDIAINITMQETANRYSVGLYSVNYKVGVSGYQEYWHYDRDQRSEALQTYEEVLKCVGETVELIEYNEIPVTLAKPLIRARIFNIDPGHKERSGVYFYNWYATGETPAADWRETIYGARYPDNRYLERMEQNWNEPDKPGAIETTGQGRNKAFQVRYASQNKTTHDVYHIKESGKGLGFLLGLSPGLIGAFLLWATHAKNIPAESVIQQAQENPQQLAPLVEEFQQHAEIPTYEPESAQEPAATPDHFDDVLNVTLQFEGGYSNDPSDRGGETFRGITRKVYEKFLKQNGLPTDNVDMRQIPQEHIEQLYRTMYWDKAGCDQLPPILAQQVFDFAVNSGASRAVRYLQWIVGAKKDGVFGPNTKALVEQYIAQHGEQSLAREYVQKRRDFITASKKIHQKFKKGLLDRVNTLEQLIDAPKPMPIKPNSPTMRAKNPPEPIIRPFDTKQVEIFDNGAKAMPLDPNAYATEPTPHRLLTHMDSAPSPWGGVRIPQPQDPKEIEQLYAGVHASQSIALAAVYANNRATPDDPGVVIEFATGKQWEPDVDAMNHYIDYIHEKVEEIDGLREAITKFEEIGDIDWQYVEEVFDEIESDDEWPELEREWSEDVNDHLQWQSERGTLSSLADFFKTYYKDDESQRKFDFEPPRYIKGFYEWYLVPLFTGGQMDARIDGWFKNQMRFMESIGEEEILAIYKVERYNPELYDPWDADSGAEEYRETDDEGRQLIPKDEVDYWEPSLSTLWEAPNAQTVRAKNIPVYYHGTSLSRAKQALEGILDVRAAASELVTLYGKHWGKVATALKSWGIPKKVIASVNEQFLKINCTA